MKIFMSIPIELLKEVTRSRDTAIDIDLYINDMYSYCIYI